MPQSISNGAACPALFHSGSQLARQKKRYVEPEKQCRDLVIRSAARFKNHSPVDSYVCVWAAGGSVEFSMAPLRLQIAASSLGRLAHLNSDTVVCDFEMVFLVIARIPI